MARPFLYTCFYFSCDPNQNPGSRHHLALEWSSQNPKTVNKAMPKKLSSSKLNIFVEWENLMLCKDQFITLQRIEFPVSVIFSQMKCCFGDYWIMYLLNEYETNTLYTHLKIKLKLRLSAYKNIGLLRCALSIAVPHSRHKYVGCSESNAVVLFPWIL